ncbi:MAG: hypothetical protein DMF64_00200 [Acidobacteria bacterium]|nr:MAG: hypothetical protein DMF64_00200 [Acidobacteriota bacterium]
MQLGRIFRRMGLPLWTFIGVGVAAIWFNYLGSLIEKIIRDVVGISETTRGWKTYVPQFSVFVIPFVIIVIAWLWQKGRYKLSKMKLGGARLQQPEGKKGLILLISNPNSAMFAVEYHFRNKGKLEAVWLIPSNDVVPQEKSAFGLNTSAIAGSIEQSCDALAKQLGRPLKVEIHPTGVSPADSQDTFDYVNRIFRHSGYEIHELIADFTGGTKPMSVGMIMACLPTQRELEYVPFNSATQTMHGPFLIDYQHRAFDLVG